MDTGEQTDIVLWCAFGLPVGRNKNDPVTVTVTAG